MKTELSEPYYTTLSKHMEQKFFGKNSTLSKKTFFKLGELNSLEKISFQEPILWENNNIQMFVGLELLNSVWMTSIMHWILLLERQFLIYSEWYLWQFYFFKVKISLIGLTPGFGFKSIPFHFKSLKSKKTQLPYMSLKCFC